MKRTATTMMLLAGFGGGCMSPTVQKDPVGGFGTVSKGMTVPGVVGPNGEPVMAQTTTARGVPPSGVMPAGGPVDGGGFQQVALFKPVGSTSGTDCPTCAYVPGVSGSGNWGNGFAAKLGGTGGGCANGNCGVPGYGPFAGGPGGPGGPYPPAFGPGGIMPVPGQGPPGAVAAYGAMGVGGGPGGGTPGVVNGRSSIKFTGPAGMKITWQLPGGAFNDEASGLTAPKEYNFLQGQTYRLRLTQILPNHPGKSFYPTLEVSAGNPKSVTFLAHSSVPLTFTNDDFDQAAAGNLVVKVVYLPDRENQDFATVAGAEELVSTRLEPGADPVAEAQRRGTILTIVRLGNIDLENKTSPAMSAPPMMPRGGPIMLPGPGMTTPGSILLPMPPMKPSSTPLLTPTPGSKPAGTGAGTSSTTIPVPPATLGSLPLPPGPPPSGSTGSGSGFPTVLPPIVPSGPGGGLGSGLPVPPIK